MYFYSHLDIAKQNCSHCVKQQSCNHS